VRGNQNKDTPLPREEPTGRNPADGAHIDYWLASDAKGPVTLRILDASGQAVREFSSSDTPMKLPAERYFEERWLGAPPSLSTQAGAHRFTWDLRLPRPVADSYGYSIAAVDGDADPLLPQGMLAAPGRYTVVLSANGRTQRSPLEVVADPRVPVDAAAVAQALAFSSQVADAMQREAVANGELQAVRKQLKGLDAKHPQLVAPLQAFTAQLAPLAEGEGTLAPLNLSGIGGELTALQSDLEGSDAAPTAPQRAVYADDAERLQRALRQWSQVKQQALAQLNVALKAAHEPAIRIPSRTEVPVVDAGVSREMP